MTPKPELIVLKDATWLRQQKIAGKCVQNVLGEVGRVIETFQPNLSLKHLEKMALRIIAAHDCSATFLNYKGFPTAICASVNKQLVHGIANDYVLQDGDVISIDVGATYSGAIADAARTWIYGKPKDNRHVSLLKFCNKALQEAKKYVKVGNRLGSIGNAISKVASSNGFGVITEYGGHGLDYNCPHAMPFVENKQKSNVGIRLVNGLTIAIEPMFVIGDVRTEVSKKDGWTVYTNDIGAHFEDTVTLFNNELHIITDCN